MTMIDLRPRTQPYPPKNTNVMLFGDSQGQHNASVAGGYRRSLAYGAVNWAAYLSRQRVNFQPTDCWAVFGMDTGQILNGVSGQITAVGSAIASYGGNVPGIAVVDCGTNDVPHGLTLAQSKINIQGIIAQIRGAGSLVFWLCPRPRDISDATYGMTATQARNYNQLIDYIKSLHAPANGIWIVDTWEDLLNPTDANMAMITAATYDKLHIDQYGAYLNGLRLAKLWGLGEADGSIIPFVDALRPGRSVFNAYNATDYPAGFLNANPQMAGSPASSWTVNPGSTGIASSLSKVTGLLGQSMQQVVLSGTPANQNFWYYYQNPITAANLAIGDVVEGFCDFEMDAGSAGLNCLGLVLQDNTSFIWSMAFDQSSDILDRPLPGVAHQGVMRLPRFTLTSTGVRFGIGCKARSSLPAVGATFRVGTMFLKKVI